MSKRTVWASLLVIVLFSAAAWSSASSQARTNDVKFPGTYSTANEFAPGLTFRGLGIFNDDGTMIATNIAQFGDPGLSGRLSTNGYGVWEKTGPRSVVVTIYYFVAVPATGAVDGVGKTINWCEFDKGADAGSCTFVGEVFPCPAGPLTCPEPADLPAPSATSGAYTFRRLPVQ